MKIDPLCMMVAVTQMPDIEGACAYLNRCTGEIVFVNDSFGQSEALLGKDDAIAIVFDQAMIEANPDVWLKIPKGPSSHPEFDWEEHARQFLKQHGIEAEIA
jgi:hypothetical protein